MSEKLTKAMIAALKQVVEGSREAFGHRFPTLEALRRRGLVERHSFDIRRAWYADSRFGEIEQPHWRGMMHQWFATDAGRSALQNGGGDG